MVYLLRFVLPVVVLHGRDQTAYHCGRKTATEQNDAYHPTPETVTGAASILRLRSRLEYSLPPMPIVRLVLLRRGRTPAVNCVYFAADLSSNLVF